MPSSIRAATHNLTTSPPLVTLPAVLHDAQPSPLPHHQSTRRTHPRWTGTRDRPPTVDETTAPAEADTMVGWSGEQNIGEAQWGGAGPAERVPGGAQRDYGWAA